MLKYMLEITMESCVDGIIKRGYIKRSFPAEPGILDISRYGYPFDKYKTVEICEVHNPEISYYNAGRYVKLKFDGEDICVTLNEFVTVRREYNFMEARASVPHSEVIHTTFYLYIE